MVIPIIMAVWLGLRARQLGRNWFGWALLGFFLPILVNTVVANFLAFVLSDGTMELAVEPYVAVMVAGAVAGIVVTVIVGRKALKPRKYDRAETSYGPGPSEESESSPWSADATREESPAETADQHRVR